MDGSKFPKQRGSEEVWLDAAFDVLKESGIEAVKVMPLAKRLGLTRTGFYWHFKDRDALLERIVLRWENKNTGNLVAQTKAYAETITEATFNLFACWLDDDLFDAKLDLAIRNWARNEPALQERLERSDRRRIGAIVKMFSGFDYSAEQSEVRAMAIIYTQIGYISMQVSESREGRIVRMPDYIEVFTGKRPSASEIERFSSRFLSES